MKLLIAIIGIVLVIVLGICIEKLPKSGKNFLIFLGIMILFGVGLRVLQKKIIE